MNDLVEIFTAKKEYDSWLTDEYGRQRLFSNPSVPVFEPVVSRKLFESGLEPVYPEKKKFAFCLSHDIDLLYQHLSMKQRIKNTINPAYLRSAEMRKYHLRSLLSPRQHPHYSLDRLSDINEKWGIRSTYFFLSLQTGERDFNYNIRDIRDQIRRLQALGNEIGLHGGHEAYNNLDKVLAEKRLLESEAGITCSGYRNHYLRFDTQCSWQILGKAGFTYDSTFAFADSVGFRNGMCYPFYPYDVRNQRFLPIIELPLIVMDATFFYYMRLDIGMIRKIMKDLLQKVSAIGGVFTLLWHNNNLHGAYEKLYNELLEMVLSYDPWVSTTDGLVSWWKTSGLLDKQQKLIKECFRL